MLLSPTRGDCAAGGSGHSRGRPGASRADSVDAPLMVKASSQETVARNSGGTRWPWRLPEGCGGPTETLLPHAHLRSPSGGG